MVWSVFPWCSSWCVVVSCFLSEYDRCWSFVKNFIQSGPILQHHKYFFGRGAHLNELSLFLSFSLSQPLFGPRVYCNTLNRLRGFPFASAVVLGGKLPCGSECKPISCWLSFCGQDQCIRNWIPLAYLDLLSLSIGLACKPVRTTIYREGLFWALVIHRPSLVTLANICKYTTSTVQTRTLRRMKCHIFSLSYVVVVVLVVSVTWTCNVGNVSQASSHTNSLLPIPHHPSMSHLDNPPPA